MLRRQKKRRPGAGAGSEDTEVQDPDDEQETFDVSPQIVVVFVVIMCGMLVALYFFYDYLGML